MINDTKARTAQDVYGQAEGHEVEGVEELGAELQGRGLGTLAAAEGCILDQGEVEIMEARCAEGIPPQGSEAALVGPRAAGNANGDRKEGGVVGALAKVVLPNLAAGGEDRCTDLIGPVGAVGAHAGLLNPRIDRKGRAAGECGDVEHLPARGELSSQGAEKAHAVERQCLDHAGREHMRDVKG